MIEISRKLIREFRAVLKRTLVDREPRGTWPLVLCQTDGESLTLQAVQEEIGLRYHQPGSGSAEAIAFRSTVLAQLEGKTDEPVTLEAMGPGKGRACFRETGEERVIEFDTVAPDSVPAFPTVPRRMHPVPDHFLRALGEAAKTAPTDAHRYALNCTQLRGSKGEMVASDGRQLLVLSGFSFPWPDDVLVPRLPVLGCRDFAPDGPVGITRTKRHVLLATGPWTFALKIESEGRYPDVDRVIPDAASVTGRLRLDRDDTTFLMRALPKLPGREEHNAPVTLDLGHPVAVRARGDEPGPPTELVLQRSKMIGTPVLLVLDRRHLLRAIKLGFGEMQVVGAANPVAFRDEHRTYVVMPQDACATVAASEDMLRIPSTEEIPLEPLPTPERKIIPMPAPSTNGQSPEDPRPQDPRERNGGLIDLFAEAEALRTLLGDALSRTSRLLVGLRQHKRQANAVQAAMASLRKLQIDH